MISPINSSVTPTNCCIEKICSLWDKITQFVKHLFSCFFPPLERVPFVTEPSLKEQLLITLAHTTDREPNDKTLDFIANDILLAPPAQICVSLDPFNNDRLKIGSKTYLLQKPIDANAILFQPQASPATVKREIERLIYEFVVAENIPAMSNHLYQLLVTASQKTEDSPVYFSVQGIKNYGRRFVISTNTQAKPTTFFPFQPIVSLEGFQVITDAEDPICQELPIVKTLFERLQSEFGHTAIHYKTTPNGLRTSIAFAKEHKKFVKNCLPDAIIYEVRNAPEFRQIIIDL